jgi:NADH dehydrogenase
MAYENLQIATGAFGFSGKYIARRLLDAGYRIRTITNSSHRANPFEGKIKAYPFNFNNPHKLVDSLRGASVLYNRTGSGLII